MTNSCIYIGKVIHKRFKPKEHYFKYSVFSLLIDLSELRKIDQEISFFSLNKFNLISFYEKDHGERDGSSLEEWVKKNSNAGGLPPLLFCVRGGGGGRCILRLCTVTSDIYLRSAYS